MVPLLVLGGAGMVALAWPVATAAAFGQTASQGLAPIAHALAVFGPGLLGYGVAFVMTRVLFAIGDVRRAALLMIGSAGVGVAWMAVTAAVLDRDERAAALAMGYGAAQTVAAVLLTMRVHRITGSMGGRVAGRVLAESLLAGAVSVAAMLAVVAQFGPGRAAAAEALLLGGVVGVAVFAVVMALCRRGGVRRSGAT